MKNFSRTGLAALAALCFIPVARAADIPAAPEAVPASEAPDPAAAPAPSTPAFSSTGPVRVIVLPVVVAGSPEPDAPLVAGVAEGLGGNPRWRIEWGGKGRPLERPPVVSLSEEQKGEFGRALDEARADLDQGRAGDAIGKFTAVRSALDAAASQGAIGPAGRALVLRAGSGLVQALIATSDETRAKQTAEDLVLRLPGEKFAGVAGLSPTAQAFLIAAAASTPQSFAAIEFHSRPAGCTIMIDGVALGPAPATVKLAPEVAYHAAASCPAAGTAASPALSSPRRVVAGAAGDTGRQILDLTYERDLINDSSGARVTFASSAERRQLEDSYARRTAEWFGADHVVFVSLGVLSGVDWLNARLYLSSGFKNRQGLARMEVPRAVALGHYIASGQDAAGVLRSEEAGALVAASHTGQQQITPKAPAPAPWYSDKAGWALAGVGAAVFGWGLYLDDQGEDKQLEAKLHTRNDPLRRQALESQAGNYNFWGGIATYGGGLLAALGVVLLIAPDYGESRSELFVLSPTHDGRGAQLGMFGRF